MLETFFPNTTNQALTKYNQIVKQINRLEPDLQKLSDLQLQKQTSDLQNKLRNKDVSKDQVLVQAFALVREATVRVLGLRHFDVQLLGGLILNDGKIAEMKTGEGKTLVAYCRHFLMPMVKVYMLLQLMITLHVVMLNMLAVFINFWV